MPPRFQVLFSLSSPLGHLVEIRRLDRGDDAPRSEVFQWLWIESGRVTTLQFVAMATAGREQRHFREGHLWFDDAHGEFSWNAGPPTPLTVHADRLLPARLAPLVDRHLS